MRLSSRLSLHLSPKNLKEKGNQKSYAEAGAGVEAGAGAGDREDGTGSAGNLDTSLTSSAGAESLGALLCW